MSASHVIVLLGPPPNRPRREPSAYRGVLAWGWQSHLPVGWIYYVFMPVIVVFVTLRQKALRPCSPEEPSHPPGAGVCVFDPGRGGPQGPVQLPRFEAIQGPACGSAALPTRFTKPLPWDGRPAPTQGPGHQRSLIT
jgi:hypothetical protein